MSPLRRPALAALVLLLPLAACGPEDGPQGITVLAAASLTEAFTTLADEFEATHDDVTVELVLGSSGALAQQVNESGPGDLLATADLASMDLVEGSWWPGNGPRVFATNTLVLVVPADNPAGVRGVEDLQDADVDWVVCVDTAPCGSIAAGLLQQAGITAEPASLEVDVKAVLAKVTSGEADAGLVYASDAGAAGGAVRALPLPGAAAATTDYPAVVLTGSSHPELAREFLDLLVSARGREVLTGAGFGAP